MTLHMCVTQHLPLSGFSYLLFSPTTHTPKASRSLVDDDQMFDVRDRMFDSLLSS
jgi:hypothetical protein